MTSNNIDMLEEKNSTEINLINRIPTIHINNFSINASPIQIEEKIQNIEKKNIEKEEKITSNIAEEEKKLIEVRKIQVEKQNEMIIPEEKNSQTSFSKETKEENKYNNILKNYDLEKLLLFQFESKQEQIKVSKKDPTIIPAMITIKTEEMKNKNGEIIESRIPIDLLCVIDCSGSMEGEKITLVQNALNILLEHLKDKDRLALITFNSSSKKLADLEYTTQNNKNFFQNKINEIIAGGGTNINSGLISAFEIMKSRKTWNSVTSIFVLSDGLDSGADKEIGNSIRLNNFEQETFSIHTFGFGTDHDPNLMSNISKLKSGNFYFIEKLDIVDECFVDGLGALTSIIAKNVEIRLKVFNQKQPLTDMRICKTYGSMFKFDENTREYSIIIPYLSSGCTKDLIIEISIPPILKQLTDETRKFDLLLAELSTEDPKTNKIIKKQLTLSMLLFNEDEKIYLDKNDKIKENVCVNHLRVKGAEIMEQILKVGDNQNFKSVQEKLDETLNEISKNPYVADKRLEVLSNDLKILKKNSINQKSLSLGRAYSTSFTKVHMEQLSNPSKNLGEDIYSSNSQNVLKTNLRKSKMF